jgi:hypothetical protein
MFLRFSVVMMGLFALIICSMVAYETISKWPPSFPDLIFAFWAVVIGTVIPFFIALFQTMKLLSYIDKNIAFSELSTKALNTIKYCAIVMSGFYAAFLPFLFRVAELDDAPGIVVIGLTSVGASITIAVFAAVLQRLLQDALNIKSENELTI